MGKFFDLTPVFIAKRQMKKQIFNGRQTDLRQLLSAFRPDAFEILKGCLQRRGARLRRDRVQGSRFKVQG